MQRLRQLNTQPDKQSYLQSLLQKLQLMLNPPQLLRALMHLMQQQRL